MPFILFCMLLLTPFALGEVNPRPGESYEEAFQRLRRETTQRLHEATERERRQINDSLRQNPEQTFVFLRREEGKAFRALEVKSFGRQSEGSCPVDRNTGDIHGNSHYYLRPTGDGQTLHIIPREKKEETQFASLVSFSQKSNPEPRWILRRQMDGSFEVCSPDGKTAFRGCRRWDIARVQNVNGPTFIRGDGDRSHVDANDIQQGSLGTCTLWAAVHALISSRGPEEVEALFSEGQVTFPGKKPVTVGDQFLFYWDPRDPKSQYPLGAHFGDEDSQGRQESWPVILEKAYTIWQRSLENTDSGNNPATVLGLLTNEKVKSFYFHPFTRQQHVLSCLKSANDNGLPTVCATKSKLKDVDSSQLSASHAYAIESVSTENGGRVVVIDPHGKTVSLSADKFFENFMMAAHTNGEKSAIRTTLENRSRDISDFFEQITP